MTYARAVLGSFYDPDRHDDDVASEYLYPDGATSASQLVHSTSTAEAAERARVGRDGRTVVCSWCRGDKTIYGVDPLPEDWHCGRCEGWS